VDANYIGRTEKMNKRKNKRKKFREIKRIKLQARTVRCAAKTCTYIVTSYHERKYFRVYNIFFTTYYTAARAQLAAGSTRLLFMRHMIII